MGGQEKEVQEGRQEGQEEEESAGNPQVPPDGVAAGTDRRHRGWGNQQQVCRGGCAVGLVQTGAGGAGESQGETGERKGDRGGTPSNQRERRPFQALYVCIRRIE